jgi:alpha-N-arabinofuranosidase
MPTFGSWEREVLELTYDQVDYISCHAYYEPHDGDLASFLASAVDVDHFVSTVTATADQVGARLGNAKQIDLSFDEWNVWSIEKHRALGRLKDWPVAPRIIEDEYTVADAVVVGSLLISLLRHSDRVTAACLAQLVNVIAPIRTEPGGPAWRQTTFHPFALTSRHAAGNVLQVNPIAPSYETARYGEVPLVDAIATHDPENRQAVLFIVNRSLDRAVEVSADVRGIAARSIQEALTLTDVDLSATNTEARPTRVVPRTLEDVSLDGGTLCVGLPPVSWSMVRLAC